jgi:hypothetical protein
MFVGKMVSFENVSEIVTMNITIKEFNRIRQSQIILNVEEG